MKKVFHFDAPREKYHCDAAILWCFDNHFELGFRKFLKRIGVVHSDPIKIAGGAMCMASPERESDSRIRFGTDPQVDAATWNETGDPDGAFRLWRLWRLGGRLSRRFPG